MEISLAKIAISIVVITILRLGWKILNWVWLRPKRLERFLRDQGLQANSYKLLFGDLKLFSQMTEQAKSKPMNAAGDILTRILPFHYQIVKNYGKNSFMWFGPTPMVIIMNPEEIRDIFTKISDFQKPVRSPCAKFLITGLVQHEGEKWAKHRKIINPAFRLEKLKQMLPAFYQCCNQMIDEWKTMVSKEGSCELDVWPYLFNMSGDVISRTAFGSSFEEGRKILKLQNEQAEYTIKLLFSVYIPGWRFLPTKMNKRMKQIEIEVQVLLKGVINKREKAMKAGEDTKDDLLGLLMESNYREIQEHGNNQKVGMSVEEIIEECKLFYFAGKETTAALLVWTMILLSMHQKWQEKAREEVLQVFGLNKPDYDGLNRLKIVTMILYEVLRLYPPGYMVDRVVLEETKLGNLVLPAGSMVCLPIILLHHDQELWGEDSMEFKPERFSEGVSKATKGQVSFFPFGGGPRICIGQNFSLMESKMALTLMLQQFSFQLSPSYAHAPLAIITIQPQFGAHVMLKKL
ncbi:Cytochrome P450 [Quillaja saponaria]|uniref:Cytochrome P450 n=1 Tax=Quillaja saponaria TaxID=32244 RepID=A0AAD7PB00_QUISA|nr:Cytochrome P450 [Quillaja saponaria]